LKIKDLIRDLRLKKNYTMVQLADLLGCKQSTISSWESGVSEPGPKYLSKLSELFGINLIDVIYKTDNNDIASEPMVVYEKTPSVEKSKDVMDSLYELIKNNEKLIDNNTKLVETNAMLSKYVIQLKNKMEMA